MSEQPMTEVAGEKIAALTAQRDKALGVVEALESMMGSDQEGEPHVCGHTEDDLDATYICRDCIATVIATFDAKPTDSEGER